MKYGVNLFFKGELIRTCKGTKKQMNKIKNKWLLKNDGSTFTKMNPFKELLNVEWLDNYTRLNYQTSSIWLISDYYQDIE